jgi:hypothetical protein
MVGMADPKAEEGTDNDRRLACRAAPEMKTRGGAAGRAAPLRYNFRLHKRAKNMEAEALNQLANTLADLRERASGLRRYL